MEKVNFCKPNDEGIIAKVSFDHEGIHFRDVRIIENEDGSLSVEYPTRVRRKRGKVVLDDQGNEIHDYIYRPTDENYQYFDTKIINLYFRSAGLPEYEEVTEFNPEIDVLATPVNRMANGIIGFAAVIYKGMMIADIAINQTSDGKIYLIFPHFKSNPTNKMFLLYTYPFDEETKKAIYKLVLDKYYEESDKLY